MGCYNVHGFYSHLPIKCGDRIGAILCAKEDRREDLGMETISTGICPIMAPIYGEYDDYGGIENIDISASANVFEKLTGVNVSEFAEMIHDFPAVSLRSKISEERKEYINILKKLKPTFHGDRFVAHNKELLKKANEEKDQYLIDAISNNIRYSAKQKRMLKNDTFFFIFEHEDVMKYFHNAGYSYLNGAHWGSEEYDVAKSYDALAKYVTLAGGSIFNVSDAVSKLHDKDMKFLNKVKNNPADPNNGDLMSLTMQHLDLQSEALIAEKPLISSFIPITDYFGCVYRNQKIDYTNSDIKNEILDLLCVDRGMYCMGGMYEMSTYAFQDINTNEVIDLHKVYEKITNNF